MEGRQNPALPEPHAAAGSRPCPARGSVGEPGAQGRVAGKPPASGHTGGFSPPWGGGEGRSEQALPGLEVSWESRAQPLPGTSRDPTVGGRSLTWFWSLGGMERMVLLSTSPMRNSDTL